MTGQIIKYDRSKAVFLYKFDKLWEVKSMEYLIKFDEDGKKIAAVTDEIHYSTAEERQKYIDDGYIPATQSEWQKYCGVYDGEKFIEYRRDSKTGKPVKFIPPVIDKTYEIKDREYKEELDFYVKAWAIAELANDNTLKNALRKDFAEWAGE